MAGVVLFGLHAIELSLAFVGFRFVLVWRRVVNESPESRIERHLASLKSTAIHAPSNSIVDCGGRPAGVVTVVNARALANIHEGIHYRTSAIAGVLCR